MVPTRLVTSSRNIRLENDRYRQQHIALTYHLLRNTQIKEALRYEYEEEVERGNKGRVKKRITRKGHPEPAAPMLI